jgi:hypothetical protein
MLEVSRDAAAAGEEQLASCTVEQSKYCSICTVVTFDPSGDLPFMSWVVGSVFAAALTQVFYSCYAACDCGTDCRCEALPGGVFGDMLEAMARIAPLQPNEAMAQIAPRSPIVPMVNKIYYSIGSFD